MRCKTCRGEVRFVAGTWTHVVENKCTTVVVDWPRPLTDDEDEAAAPARSGALRRGVRGLLVAALGMPRRSLSMRTRTFPWGDR